jgi:hypothetical protein
MFFVAAQLQILSRTLIVVRWHDALLCVPGGTLTLKQPFLHTCRQTMGAQTSDRSERQTHARIRQRTEKSVRSGLMF